MFREFKEFAAKGNMLDMAVGIVLGVAFGTVVTSLVDDVLMPPIGLLLGGVDFSQMAIPVGTGPEGEAVAINIGLFINALIAFLIIAFSVFLVVRGFNRMQREEEVAAEEAPAHSQEAALLTEIRDLLRQSA